MPKINPLDSKQKKYLQKHNLEQKYNKQKKLFENDISYRSLNTELLKPKSEGLYSFRLDRKYRAIFIYIDENIIEIVDINLHYS